MSRGRTGADPDRILRRLGLRDHHLVEAESKWRVPPGRLDAVFRRLLGMPSLRYRGSRAFHDRFLDTPALDLLRRRVSLRLRYRKEGTDVCLQYKGAGVRLHGVLLRPQLSEQVPGGPPAGNDFHNIVHGRPGDVGRLLSSMRGTELHRRLVADVGKGVIRRIGPARLVCMYHKEKFSVPVGRAALELSLDRMTAVRTSGSGPDRFATLCEYENELKYGAVRGPGWLSMVWAIPEFDRRLAARFGFGPERRDKYQRCAASVGLQPRRK